VLAAIRETGALDYTRRQADVEAKRAAAALESLPRSTYRESLLQLAAFAVSRSY
jgi:octaprenyl-diphosphate synthase